MSAFGYANVNGGLIEYEPVALLLSTIR
jgi:hypothetical protein